MAEKLKWILTDVDRRVWIEGLELAGADLGVGDIPGVGISKYTLRGGLSDGVDVIEVRNGALSFTLLPTRGMGLWRGDYKGTALGWRSPVHGPVNPTFVNLTARGGLGWLEGFDECIVRCGLESNGAPATDIVPNNMGVPTPIEFGLHGRIANTSAHFVEIEITPGDPAELTVRGIVDESMLFCPQFRLITEISTRVGSNAVRITDRILNMRSTAAEMELLYHCNFASPVLDEGARLVVPASDTMPRDAYDADDVDKWDTYCGPTAGFVEQCFWHVPLADDAGDSMALLRNAAGDKGVTIRFNVNQLPCFTQWKNTAAESDGYVTGLEPGTDYPNARPFERATGRLVTVEAGAEHCVDLTMEVHDSAEAVQSAEREIADIQGTREHTIHSKPMPEYTDMGD